MSAFKAMKLSVVTLWSMRLKATYQREKPVAICLFVSGMPVGSLGMEMPGEMLGGGGAFDVVFVTRDGGSLVYESYTAKRAAKSSVRSWHIFF